jgi:hypothetical protein
MTRSLQRIADQCRQRAADDRFLKRFGMADAGTPQVDELGPGWYESSRDLEAGLHVREGCGDGWMAEWHEACRRYVPPRLATQAASTR